MVTQFSCFLQYYIVTIDFQFPGGLRDRQEVCDGDGDVQGDRQALTVLIEPDNNQPPRVKVVPYVKVSQMWYLRKTFKPTLV